MSTSGLRAWLRDHPTAKFLGLAVLVIGIDQAVKLLVKLNMDYYEALPDPEGFFKIYFIENQGAAFGVTLSKLFGGLDDTTAKLLLTIFSLVLVTFIGVYLYRVRNYRTGLPWAVALILAGALGNIIDRVFYGAWFAEINNYEGGLLHGRVVDMFYFDFGRLDFPEFLGGGSMEMFPVFNVADTAITTGILMILVFQKRFFAPERALQEAKKAQQAQAS